MSPNTLNIIFPFPVILSSCVQSAQTSCCSRHVKKPNTPNETRLCPSTMSSTNNKHEATDSSCYVFDGSTTFEAWREEFELLLSTQDPILNGFLLVAGYDGSQSFMLRGDKIPPLSNRNEVETVDDDDDDSEPRLVARPWKTGELVKNRAKTSTLLRHNVSERYRVILSKDKTVYQVWQDLVTHCGKNAPADFPSVYAKMVDTRMKYMDSPVVFVHEFEERIRHVEAITGSVLSAIHRSLMLQRALPDS